MKGEMMKKWMLGGVMSVVLAAIFFGCATAEPTAFERRFFNIETNVTEKVVVVTNTVTRTNIEVATITVTNTEHQVLTSQVTNYTAVAVPVVVNVTNLVPTYVFTPNTNAAQATAVAAKLGELSGIPGVGTIVGLVGSLFWGLWGTMRSSKKGKTAASLVQVIEVGREFLARTPQGQQAADAWTQWMVQHQAEQGVIQDVIQLLPKAVDSPAANQVADELLAMMGPRSTVTATRAVSTTAGLAATGTGTVGI